MTKFEILRSGATIGPGFTAWEYLNNQGGGRTYVYNEIEFYLPSPVETFLLEGENCVYLNHEIEVGSLR